MEVMWFVIVGINRKNTVLGLKNHLPGVTACMNVREPLSQQNVSVTGDFRHPQIDQDMCSVFLDTIKCCAE